MASFMFIRRHWHWSMNSAYYLFSFWSRLINSPSQREKSLDSAKVEFMETVWKAYIPDIVKAYFKYECCVFMIYDEPDFVFHNN
jgi:hypothetical protein